MSIINAKPQQSFIIIKAQDHDLDLLIADLSFLLFQVLLDISYALLCVFILVEKYYFHLDVIFVRHAYGTVIETFESLSEGVILQCNFLGIRLVE